MANLEISGYMLAISITVMVIGLTIKIISEGDKEVFPTKHCPKCGFENDMSKQRIICVRCGSKLVGSNKQ